MAYHVPLIIRGRVIEDKDAEFGGRGGGVKFTAPDVKKHLAELAVEDPGSLADLHALTSEEVFDYLEALGDKLTIETNPYLQEAFELSIQTSGLTPGIIKNLYRTLGKLFRKDRVREMAENAIGIKYLDGWVPRKLASGCICNVRAFGARAVHVLAGNVPMPSALGVIRNAIIRSDAIFKTPSNDPVTAAAIGRTMVDLAPDHPITKHLSIAYWKGGDTEVESYLYRPDRIEKIVAWGGYASIKHITQYIQPGLDLISMDPKLSSSIIGREAFESESTMRAVAERAALDMGYYNQQACASSRVMYIATGTDAAGLARANRFGELVFEALQALPPHCSGPLALPDDLAEEMQGLKFASDDHKIFGSGGPEGAVIVSQIPEPVDFAPLLNNRVANFVPVDDMEIPIQSVTSYTQTISIYPDSLKERIRDRLVFNGAQRLASLGYSHGSAMAGPHDGMEPLRRMCKWISDEINDPNIMPLLSRQ